jgi:hypothetical protein
MEAPMRYSATIAEQHALEQLEQAETLSRSRPRKTRCSKPKNTEIEKFKINKSNRDYALDTDALFGHT